MGRNGIHLSNQGEDIFASRMSNLISKDGQNFKWTWTGWTGKGEGKHQPCKGVMDRAAEQTLSRTPHAQVLLLNICTLMHTVRGINKMR